jgi:hypothetical protein
MNPGPTAPTASAQDIGRGLTRINADESRIKRELNEDHATAIGASLLSPL